MNTLILYYISIKFVYESGFERDLNMKHIPRL